MNTESKELDRATLIELYKKALTEHFKNTKNDIAAKQLDMFEKNMIDSQEYRLNGIYHEFIKEVILKIESIKG